MVDDGESDTEARAPVDSEAEEEGSKKGGKGVVTLVKMRPARPFQQLQQDDRQPTRTHNRELDSDTILSQIFP